MEHVYVATLPDIEYVQGPYRQDFDPDTLHRTLLCYPEPLSLKLARLYCILTDKQGMDDLEAALRKADSEDFGMSRANRLCFLHEQLTFFRYELVPYSPYILGEIQRDNLIHKRAVSKIADEQPISDTRSFSMFQNDPITFVGVWWEWPRWKHVESVMQRRHLTFHPKKDVKDTSFTPPHPNVPTVWWEGDDAPEEIEWGMDKQMCERKYQYFQTHIEWLGANLKRWNQGLVDLETMRAKISRILPGYYYRSDLTDSDWKDVAEGLTFLCCSQHSWQSASKLCSLLNASELKEFCDTQSGKACMPGLNTKETDTVCFDFLRKKDVANLPLHLQFQTEDQIHSIHDWILAETKKEKGCHKIVSQIRKHESIVQMTDNPNLDVDSLDLVVKLDILNLIRKEREKEEQRLLAKRKAIVLEERLDLPSFSLSREVSCSA
mgnify:CR=1 FL=1